MAGNQSRPINDYKTAEKHENPPENSTDDVKIMDTYDNTRLSPLHIQIGFAHDFKRYRSFFVPYEDKRRYHKIAPYILRTEYFTIFIIDFLRLKIKKT